jgi:hypothetical protein
MTDEDTALTTEAFLERITRLTTPQWAAVMVRARVLGDGMLKEDLIRGAVVAITVRPVLPARHFEILYMPFADVIPFATLGPGKGVPG